MKNVFYINLDEREKRKETCEKQLQQLEWKFERFPAIKHKNGAIGCALSHLRILQRAKKEKLKYVIIFEDDFIIVNIEKFKAAFQNFLKQKPYFDVLKLGANPFPPYKQITKRYLNVNYSQTTHAYMVFDHYYNTLIKNYKESIYLMNKYGNGPMGIFCCDAWQNTLIHNNNHTWLVLLPLTITQKTDYSDIEKKRVAYSRSLLNIKFSTTKSFRHEGDILTEKDLYEKMTKKKLYILLNNYKRLKNEIDKI